MIVIEINDETGVSHYEVLGFKPDELDGLDDKALSRKVSTAAKKAKRSITQAAQRGDKEAEKQEDLINSAMSMLKNPDKKAEYDKELASGKGALLEILQVQPVEAPFYRDRGARFRALERLLREAGLVQPVDFAADVYA